MRNGPKAPPPQQPIQRGPTPEQLAMMRRNEFFHQIKTAIGFVLACTSAGFLITIGQHLAVRWLGAI